MEEVLIKYLDNVAKRHWAAGCKERGDCEAVKEILRILIRMDTQYQEFVTSQAELERLLKEYKQLRLQSNGNKEVKYGRIQY